MLYSSGVTKIQRLQRIGRCNNKILNEASTKGKPFERTGRKATDLLGSAHKWAQ